MLFSCLLSFKNTSLLDFSLRIIKKRLFVRKKITWSVLVFFSICLWLTIRNNKPNCSISNLTAISKIVSLRENKIEYPDFYFKFSAEILWLFFIFFISEHFSWKLVIEQTLKMKLFYKEIQVYSHALFILSAEPFSPPISWRSWRKLLMKLTIQTCTPEKCSPWRLSYQRTEYRCVSVLFMCVCRIKKCDAWMLSYYLKVLLQSELCFFFLFELHCVERCMRKSLTL